MLNRKGAAGIDRVSMTEYEENLEEHLKALVTGMKARRYRAPHVRIPKTGNQDKLRPLGIPTVEDRLLQASVARILHAIYEADFPACSYGYRPGRNPHQALAEIRRIILTEPIQWIYEADIRSFFDNLDHEWLMKMVELRVGDPWILRLIRKWPGAGIFDNGTVVRPEKGTPQGGPLSPVLANIYLHYVLDLWFERAFKQTCYGKGFLIRFADVYIHYKGYPIPPSEETVGPFDDCCGGRSCTKRESSGSHLAKR
jgi:group II intron reverse transcriptase/maturase